MPGRKPCIGTDASVSELDAKRTRLRLRDKRHSARPPPEITSSAPAHATPAERAETERDILSIVSHPSRPESAYATGSARVRPLESRSQPNDASDPQNEVLDLQGFQRPRLDSNQRPAD
jgi:hypothetical protein